MGAAILTGALLIAGNQAHEQVTLEFGHVYILKGRDVEARRYRCPGWGTLVCESRGLDYLCSCR